MEEIAKWLDNGSPVDVIYLDFQKAFGKVPYQRLLLILKAYGIGDGIVDRIEQWLTDRKQIAVCRSRGGGFKLEISFAWGTTRISVRTFIVLNIHQ